MVGINKKGIEWGENDVLLDEPPGSLQSDGYPGGEQPFGEHHNWIFNETDRRVNDLIHDRNVEQTQSGGQSIEEYVSQAYWSKDMLHAYAPENTIYLSSEPVDMCNSWNYSRRRPSVLVARLGYQGVTELTNLSNMSVDIDQHPLTLDAPGETIDAICSDGDFLYVMATNIGAPFGAKFYKFNVNPWSPVKIWSSTSSSDYDQTNRGKNDLIIADDNWIAAPITGAAADTGTAVRLTSKDGLSNASGAGNASGNPGRKPAPYLASNGTVLFFAEQDPSGSLVPEFCTANIADPTQATNPSGPVGAFPSGLGSDAGAGVGSIIFDGRLVHFITAGCNIYSHDWLTNTHSAATHAQWAIENSPIPQVGTDHPSMAFDGVNMWPLMELEGLASNNSGFVVPINVASEDLDQSASREVTDPKTLVTPPVSAAPTMNGTKIVASDNCLWMTTYIHPTSPGLTVMRLPNINARR